MTYTPCTHSRDILFRVWSKAERYCVVCIVSAEYDPLRRYRNSEGKERMGRRRLRDRGEVREERETYYCRSIQYREGGSEGGERNVLL